MSKVLRLSDTGGEIPKGYKLHFDLLIPENTNVVWTPNPGSQTLALNCPAQQLLYSSGRGCGKSILQLMRFRKSVGLGYGSYWSGLIIDRGYKNLDDLINKSKQVFPLFNDGAKFYSSKGDLRWQWSTGEFLMFRAVDNEDDYAKLHGSQSAYIGFNELTQYPDLSLYDLVTSLNRTGFVPEDHKLPNGTTLPEIPMCILSTTNPSGVGGLAVKRRFVDAGKNGEIVKKEVKIFNPRTQQDEIIIKTQCHIFGSYRENTKLDAAYVADLESITDTTLRRFWLLGDWSACGEDGGMFTGIFDKSQHVIEPFDIPKTWEITRTFDYGESKPSSVCYFAESNGEDVTLRNGKIKSTIKGDLFHIGEIYTCLEGYNNRGTRMLPQDLAKMIIEYELSTGIYDRVKPGVADTAIFTSSMGNSIAGIMQQPVTIGNKVYPGVSWVQLSSLKKPGSRKDGIQKFKERLCNSLVTPETSFREKPGFFVFNTCKYFIEIVPVMMRDKKDPDDVDGTVDHILDATRYKILSMNTGLRQGKTIGLT
jgi:hypothetical protein